MKRIIIFTGKGGVGKTSVAAAHARKASLEGKKTLIVSTDMAHNLSDLFECHIGKEETEIADLLYALEIDPNYEMAHDFSFLMNGMQNFLSSMNASINCMEDLGMIPGIEELFSLLKIQALYEKGDYDLIIVDCAPTGETLSLLKFPELLSWYMEKFFPVGKIAVRVMRPVSKALFKVQLPDKKAMNDMERLYIKLAELQELMRSRESCSVRIVSIPEKMAVEETKRNYMYLNLYNFNIDGLYINRILPRDMNNPFFDEWLELQDNYVEELKNVFSQIPVYKIPWFDSDLNGLESLDRVCEEALKEEELFSVRNITVNEVYEKKDNGYLLKVFLPCITKEELIMHHSDNELIIKIGNMKRNIPMPDVLRNHTVESARMNEEKLEIFFAKG